MYTQVGQMSCFYQRILSIYVGVFFLVKNKKINSRVERCNFCSIKYLSQAMINQSIWQLHLNLSNVYVYVVEPKALQWCCHYSWTHNAPEEEWFK